MHHRKTGLPLCGAGVFFMAKDPAFLFYASDFLTGTMFFSNEQVGKYIRLLCSQHQHGGFIEKKSFNSLVGNDDVLRQKFIETEHGFYNVRLSLEMEARAKKSSNISEAAKQTWKKRKNTIVIQSYKKSNTNVIRIEDEDENEIKDDNVIENNTHLIFAERFFESKYELDREAVEISTKKEVTREILQEFNANLLNSNKKHFHFSEYKKHLVNWLGKKPAKKLTKVQELLSVNEQVKKSFE